MLNKINNGEAIYDVFKDVVRDMESSKNHSSEDLDLMVKKIEPALNSLKELVIHRQIAESGGWV